MRKSDSIGHTPPAGTDPADNSRTLKIAGALLAGVAFFYAVLLASGWLWPRSFLWGVHALAFLPVPVSVVFVVLALFLAFPPVSRLYMQWLERLPAGWARRPSRRAAVCIILGVLAGIIFFSARNVMNMYGDEKTLLNVLAGKSYSIGSIVHLEDYAPLTRLIHQQVALLTGLDQRTAIALTSSAAGGIFAGLLLWFATSLDGPRAWKIFLLIIGLGSGATQLFFGYVEDYTLVYGCMAVFLMLGWKFLDGGRVLGWLVIAYVVGLFLHIEMILLTPALMYAAAVALSRRVEGIRRWLGMDRVLGVVVLSLVPALFAYFYIFHAAEFAGSTDQERISKTFLPLQNYLPEPHHYTLLSLNHISDIVQELLLVVSPGAVLVLLLSVVGGEKRHRTAPKVIFFGLGLFYLLIFDCTVNPLLTPMRDWDFLSLVSAPAAFLAMALSRRWFAGAVAHRFGSRIIGFALGALILPASFITVNAREESGAARLRSIGEWAFESYYIGSGYMLNIGCLMMNDMRAQVAERIAILDRIEAHASPNDEEIAFLTYKCGVALHEAGEYGAAISYFRKSLAESPGNASAVKGIALDLMLTGDYAASVSVIDPLRAAVEAGQVRDRLALRIASDAARCVELSRRPEDSLALRSIVQEAGQIHLR